MAVTSLPLRRAPRLPHAHRVLPADTPARRDPSTLTHEMRATFARFVFRVYTLTGERPTKAVIDYLRPFIEDDIREDIRAEAAAMARLERLTPAGIVTAAPRPTSARDSMPLRSRRMSAEARVSREEVAID